MKLPAAIAILLVANLGLLIYLIQLRFRPAMPMALHAGVGAQTTPGKQARTVVPEATTVTNKFRWEQLESEDYRAYIERLREIGCPEQTIRDIIISDLDKLFSPRLRALYPYRENLQYWQPEEVELLNNVNQDQALRDQRTIEGEKRAVIKELMGVDLLAERLKDKGQEDYYQRRLAFLPEDKRSEVRDVLEKFHDLGWSIREKQWKDGAELSATDRAELSRLRREKDAALNALLTGPEREQFDLWLSDAAAEVRHDVYGMDATEQEFLTIYKMQKQFEQQWPADTIDLSDPLTRQRYEQGKEAMQSTLRAQLGDARYAAYQRGQDPVFHELSSTVSRYNLPPQKAVEVYEYKKDYLGFRDAVGFNAALTPEQKDAAFRALYEETLRSIKEALGEPAYTDYMRKAQWLQQ